MTALLTSSTADLPTDRAQLAVALAEALPGWQIVAHTRALDSVRPRPGIVLSTF